MSNLIRIDELGTWKEQLGLLPVPLFDHKRSGEEYVLLNGNFGNFCLGLNVEREELKARNYAWSSDVGHYINIIKDTVEIYRWDKSAHSLEKYNKKSIEENLEKFYGYLQKDQPRKDISIVSFAANVFRRLRGAFTDQAVDGARSLKAFLYLLACTSDTVNRNNLDLSKWSLDNEAKKIADLIRPGDWQTLMDDLILGLPLYALKPDIPLLLRHASGRLFQEAHYITTVENANQNTFDGFSVRPVSLAKKTASIGVHYTPSAIVRTLVEEALNAIGDLPLSLTVFDPACGSSEFLREVLRQLSLRKYKGNITLIGWDISQSAVDISKFVLAREAALWNKHVRIEISHKDALLDDTVWPQDVDIVLMNPPFRSWQDMDKNMRETTRTILKHLFEKKPDMASLFIWKAAYSLRNGGIIGTVLPASMLDADSYKKLREEFALKISPLLIGKLGSQSLFLNATVDAAIYVGQASKGTEIPAIALWSDHRLESASAALRSLRRHRATKNSGYTLTDGEGYSIYPHPFIGKAVDSWTARSYKSYKLFDHLKKYTRVKDFFEVKQGVKTGLNKVFILSKATLLEKIPENERFFSVLR